MKRSGLLQAIAAGVFLAGSAAFFCWRRIALEPPPIPTDFIGDLLRYYLPNLLYSSAEIGLGRLPLWNPYEFAGMPMLATFEYGPFYPPNWLYCWFPMFPAHVLVGAIHLTMLLAFMYLFLRRAIEMSRMAALFGSFAFGFSSWSILQMLAVPDTYRAAVWIPLLLLLADRLVQKPDLRRALALAVVFVAQFFAGESEISARTAILLVPWFLFRLIRQYRRGMARRTVFRAVGCIAVAGLMAAGLAAIQLFPLAELSLNSARTPGGLSFQQAFRQGLPEPLAVIRHLCSGSDGDNILYVGVIPILLAAFAFLRVRATTWFFAVLAAISFELIRGEVSPVAWAYYHFIPTGSWFRSPWRFAPFLLISVSVLSAMGLDAVADALVKKRRIPLTVAAAAVAALIGIGAGSLSVEMTLPAAALALSTGLAAPAVLVKRGPLLMPAATIVLISTLLVFPFMTYPIQDYGLPRQVQLTAMPREIHEYLRGHLKPGERIYADYATGEGRRVPKIGTLLRIPCLTGQSPFVLPAFWTAVRDCRADRLLENERKAPFDMPSVGLWGGPALHNSADQRLSMFGVRYLVLGPGNEFFGPFQMDWLETARKNPKFTKRLLAKDMAILEMPEPWPRAFFLNPFCSNLDELDRYKQTIVPVEIVQYRPGRAVVQIPQHGPGYLVLTDQFYPGWQARADGKPRTILQYAGLFQSIQLDGNERQITFIYKPNPFRVGSAITGLSLAALVPLAIPKKTRKKTSEPVDNPA